jgi:hypothetical protein
MKTLARVVAAALLGTLAASAVARAAEADLPAEAAAVLDRFLGSWQTEATIRQLAAHPPREIHTRGAGDCRRTLEGRYYEFRTHTIPPGDSELQVMTYDADARVYRQWVFSSDGYRHEATGTWDPQTTTLTWQGRTDAGQFVIADHFVSADRLEWKLERQDDSGKQVQTIAGVLERVTAP